MSARPHDRPALRRAAVVAAVMLAVALALRGWQFGNPAIHEDDQFYLLVGDRMLHGALPYVDIWDRKPVGLFLIYAAIRLLGGDGVVQYQIVATLFATATAGVIALLARRFAGRGAAVAAGVAYLVWLQVYGGNGGQSPVFYNLLVALAALVTLDATTGGADERLRRRGCLAMLLVGLAFQVKGNAVFEGMFFGIMLLGGAVRDDPSPARRAGDATLWVLCALAPTIAAALAYVAAGHGGDYGYANFVSIFARTGDGDAAKRLRQIAVDLIPLAGVAVYGLAVAPRDAKRRFLTGWTIAALTAFLVFGTYYDHYTLPLLMPLTVAAASAFSRRRIGPALLIVVLTAGLIFGRHAIRKSIRRHGDGSQVALLTRVIVPHLRGCLYVFDGEPSLYRTTGSCLPTRYVFPSHLNHTKEAPALGVSQQAELGRVLASGPGIIVTTRERRKTVSVASRATLAAALAEHYRLIYVLPVGKLHRLVYERVTSAGPPPQ